MEQQAIKLVDIVHGDREVDFQERAPSDKVVAKPAAKATSKGTAA